MKSREEVARLVEKLFYEGVPEAGKTAFHFGYVEIHQLLDFIYDGPPKNEDECVRNPNND